MKFSVMGDSISTYEGYNPFLYDVFYTEKKAVQAGLMSVEDTWWMRVIRYFGGELCVNDSYSGSFVAGLTPASAHSHERIANLKTDEASPDIILICMGANDCGGGIPLHGTAPGDENAFDTSYSVMLERIKAQFPDASIYCATIMLTDDEATGRFKLRIDYIETYNEVIRRISALHGCKLLDTFSRETGYTTIDGLHPDKAGHRIIADRIISAILGK